MKSTSPHKAPYYQNMTSNMILERPHTTGKLSHTNRTSRKISKDMTRPRKVSKDMTHHKDEHFHSY